MQNMGLDGNTNLDIYSVWKITEKVSFNIASEASYRVTRPVNFNKTQKGEKYKNEFKCDIFG